MILDEYIEARIDRSGGPDACWPWLLSTDKDGYGKGHFEGKHIRPHSRYARVPVGKIGCHSCDNPPCCNPAHVFPGTRGMNNSDRKAKGRNADKRGMKHHMAKLTDDEVRAIRSAGGVQRLIAKQFGVTQSVVSMIRTRRIWGHVE